MHRIILILIVSILVAGAAFYLAIPKESRPIGGDRDEHGCLTPAGYAFDEEIGACIRVFELDEKEREAAARAVVSAGRGYALTIISVAENDKGLFVLMERGEKRTQETVLIKDGEAIPQQSVLLYYYNEAKDTDETGNLQCSRAGLVPVSRMVPKENAVENTIRLLLEGNLTEEEEAEGITTEYPLTGLTLVATSLEDNELVLTFDDPEGATVGGSCRVGILWSQIAETALQFPEVQRVRFMPEELFQP